MSHHQLNPIDHMAMEGHLKAPFLFSPFRIRGLELKNRIIRAAANEGMCPGGVPSDALIHHHVEMAKGGVALTTVAYASVSFDGWTTYNQLPLSNSDDDPRILKQLRKLVEKVHNAGGACSIQLTHAGYMAEKSITGVAPIGPMRLFNPAGFNFSRKMNEEDIERVTNDYVRGAERAVEVGFDAVEVHCGHGYLLSQFISPATNKRGDKWGGSLLENRVRFPAQVVRRMRSAIGDKVPIFVKQNLKDGFRGGMNDLRDSAKVTQALSDAGADCAILSGGFVVKNGLYMMRGDVPLLAMTRHTKGWMKKLSLLLFGPFVIKKYPFEEGFFQEDASEILRQVDIPICLIGGMRSLSHMNSAIRDGFSLIGLARPLYREPNFVSKLEQGISESSLCDPCNKCVAATLGNDPSACPYVND